MSSSENKSARAGGSCLCGAVRYRVYGPMRPVVSCHCDICRKTSGHYCAATATRKESFELLEDRGLKWYRSSEMARRGFCQECGSNLFWVADGADQISILAGTIDGSTALRTAMHISVESKSDYYELPVGVKAVAGVDHEVAVPDRE